MNSSINLSWMTNIYCTNLGMDGPATFGPRCRTQSKKGGIKVKSDYGLSYTS